MALFETNGRTSRFSEVANTVEIDGGQAIVTEAGRVRRVAVPGRFSPFLGFTPVAIQGWLLDQLRPFGVWPPVRA